MSETIMTGCDLHEKDMLLKVSVDKDAPVMRSFRNLPSGREAMRKWLKGLAQNAGAKRIVFAYEASQHGFGLYDELTDAGVEAYVLPPTHLPVTAKSRRNKTDERDAQRILEMVRAHVLAGNTLPTVWIPDAQTRDDREIVRARLAVRERASATKTRIRSLLKRHEIRNPDLFGTWTRPYVAWLHSLCKNELPRGAAVHLDSLLRELEMLEAEVKHLDAAVKALSLEPRYVAPAESLQQIVGVGLLTAMVFLVELGDPGRFANRRRLAAYLGLAPSSHDSGETDRKGHITRQGPGRVRKVLCQAVWSSLLHNPAARAKRDRIAGDKARGRKIATVALMRQLAIRMWHTALDAA